MHAQVRRSQHGAVVNGVQDFNAINTAVERLRALLPTLKGSSDFAQSLVSQYDRRGLSDKQVAWVHKLLAEAHTPRVVPQQQLASNVSSIKKSLDAAFARGLKRPALRITVYREAERDTFNDYHFSRAPDTGKNPGCVYIKLFGTYIGKIDGAGFCRARNCSDDDVKQLQGIAQDPLAAAAASGKLTGQCSCCGRPLSDPVSLQNGIGPICQKKFFE